ncbi:MAG: hypothetical protein IT318_12810 [Anaerolineales bacterium]|nr:hypothetical protein [Anaerolineales bacterium]
MSLLAGARRRQATPSPIGFGRHAMRVAVLVRQVVPGFAGQGISPLPPNQPAIQILA